MSKIIKNGIEYGGTATTTNQVQYSPTETVAEKIDELNEEIGNLLDLFLINTYTFTISVGAGSVTALKGQDMEYNSIPTGYTPIVFTFSCLNSNDLFFNMNSLTAIGSQQFGVIRNISTAAQNNKNCVIKITFIKSTFL